MSDFKSNEYTRLIGGADFEERNDGVKEIIRLAVEGCRRNGIHSGLYGQGPSDYVEIAVNPHARR